MRRWEEKDSTITDEELIKNYEEDNYKNKSRKKAINRVINNIMREQYEQPKVLSKTDVRFKPEVIEKEVAKKKNRGGETAKKAEKKKKKKKAEKKKKKEEKRVTEE